MANPEIKATPFKPRDDLFIDTNENEEDYRMMSNARKLLRYDRKRLLKLIGFPEDSLIKYPDHHFSAKRHQEKSS